MPEQEKQEIKQQCLKSQSAIAPVLLAHLPSDMRPSPFWTDGNTCMDFGPGILAPFFKGFIDGNGAAPEWK